MGYLDKQPRNPLVRVLGLEFLVIYSCAYFNVQPVVRAGVNLRLRSKPLWRWSRARLSVALTTY
jgi:hypothetical protein